MKYLNLKLFIDYKQYLINCPPYCFISESWIELSSSTNTCPKSPDRTTPLPFTSVEEYLRLLREAQRESKESSRVASLTSSRRDSPRGSPKSPPNSPNTELATTEEELRGVYINYLNRVSLFVVGVLVSITRTNDNLGFFS